jgi:DNA-binding CsgD family transcriptional regulator
MTELTEGQARVLDAVIRHNCIVKRAAEALRLSPKTVQAHIEHAKSRTKAANQSDLLVQWTLSRRAA